jgi:ABC-2 type transport system permease protein
MPRSVFDKTLRDQRMQIVGFGLAMGLMAASAVWLWPSVRDQLQNFEIPGAIQALLGSDLNFATPAGYLSGRYFAWTILLVIVYAAIAGTGAIAGEEGAGTMDLLLAQPISRAQALGQKLAALVLAVVLIIAGGYVGFLASVPTVDIRLSLADVAIGCANMAPISLFFLGLSIWAGAVAPNRGVAAGIVIGIATAGYFIFTLSNGVESLQPLRYSTPFYYYGAGASLVHGIVWWHVGMLLGLTAAFLAMAFQVFEHRDINAGASDLPLSILLRRAIAR